MYPADFADALSFPDVQCLWFQMNFSTSVACSAVKCSCGPFRMNCDISGDLLTSDTFKTNDIPQPRLHLVFTAIAVVSM